MPEICDPITAAELATLDLFRDDDPAALEWLAQRFETYCYAAGEDVTKEGDPAKQFGVVLEGEIHFMREGEVYGGAFIARAGDATGKLPFSRMTVFRGHGYTVQPTRLILMSAEHLPELIYKAPHLTQKLVYRMIDRARESTQRDERANKMLALGKLSAGLAHELNNPASAVVRSSARLREALWERRQHAVAMRGDETISAEARALILDLGETITEAAQNPKQIDALERADREGEFADWLEAQGLDNAVASSLVDSGIVIGQVVPLAKLLSRTALDHGLRVLAADHEVLSLSREIEEASRRIADLVKSIKEYTYMDRTPLTDVDVEQGIENTLRMFQHRTKQGVEVRRHYAGNLPKIRANGGELNQIWTNLIDNAIDAMDNSAPKVLEIRTCLEPAQVLVEVTDSGPGIPSEVQTRMFDAFFTTKEVGKGTGLGLDIVHRIIRSHRGSIRVVSAPGRTTMQVRLPLG